MLRVEKENGLSYFVQLRDNVRDARFVFPNAISFFTGGARENESGEECFRREMIEELIGINFEKLELEHRIYHWEKDLLKVEETIDRALEGNFDVFRGFQYADLIPAKALGRDRGKEVTYQQLFDRLIEDHYFVAQVKVDAIENVKIKEGQKWVLLPEDTVHTNIFYPSAKVALVHDIALRKLGLKFEL